MVRPCHLLKDFGHFASEGKNASEVKKVVPEKLLGTYLNYWKLGCLICRLVRLKVGDRNGMQRMDCQFA